MPATATAPAAAKPKARIKGGNTQPTTCLSSGSWLRICDEGTGLSRSGIALVFFVRVISSVSRACAISLHVLSYISLVSQHTLALSLFIRTKLSWSNFLWTRQLVQSRVRLAPFTRSMRSMPCAATSVLLP